MLSTTAEYALRAVIHPAHHDDERPIPGNQIAERADIPAKYLSKVLGDLVRVGVLTSLRGKRGGFGMVRSPKKTRLIDILSPFEQFEIRRCPFGNSECSDEKPCLAHNQWKRSWPRSKSSFARPPSTMSQSNAARQRGQERRALANRLLASEVEILVRV